MQVQCVPRRGDRCDARTLTDYPLLYSQSGYYATFLSLHPSCVRTGLSDVQPHVYPEYSPPRFNPRCTHPPLLDVSAPPIPAELKKGFSRMSRKSGDAARNRAAIVDYLRALPEEGSVVSAIAEHLAMGHSTVAKHLAVLEADGAVCRHSPANRTGARREPDIWHATETTAAPHTTHEATTSSEDARSEPSPEPSGTATPSEDNDAGASTPHAHPTGSDSTDETGPPASQAPPSAQVQQPTDQEPTTEDAAEPALKAPNVGAISHNQSGVRRAAPGELRAMVAEHLRDHPTTSFTAGEISNVLTRSAGAIQNALERLTANGEAERTCEAPRRYKIARPTDE
ncbi:DNA-binding transcriptional ArsR family regulator [Lipingzhangella halophila]|uniref:DNA-binding transcriptional ArsR family regulator n=1 Tax=Lipingzhangella halophila TaxID=1783352 RepID=A0A7W7RLW3_9ACTN|nr:DNA-binding transcriptional ArsR family regulator [Lipingzhangella halophila]